MCVELDNVPQRPMSQVNPMTADVLGLQFGPVEFTWTERDVILYALGIGAELPADLDYLYEGPMDGGQAGWLGPTLTATFPLVAVTRLLPPLVDGLGLDLTRLLHLGQSLELTRTPRSRGVCAATRRIVGVRDRGHATILTCADVVFDADGVLASGLSEWWVGRTEGVVADAPVERGQRARWPEPVRDGEPDIVRRARTSSEQAALYRLSGDLNPVHIDPRFAVQAGQPRPLLHGLCTLGLVTHRLARERPDLCVETVAGRFMAPVFPGDELMLRAWSGPGRRVRANTEVAGSPVLAVDLTLTPR
jgi:acyl dehydratase